MDVESFLEVVNTMTAENQFGRLRETLEQVLRELPNASLSIILSHLNPVGHSFTLTAILLFVANNDSVVNKKEWLSMVSNLFHNAKREHLAACQKNAILLAKQYSTTLLSANQARCGILPLKSLINLLSEDVSTFTAVHTEFAKLCLKAKFNSLAVDVIKHNICTIIPESCTPLDVMAYQYYKGRIFAILKDFPKSLQAFRLLLTYPCDGSSAIITEGYKYATLVNIIVHNKPIKFEDQLLRPTAPKIPSKVVDFYDSLAKACTESDISVALANNANDLEACNLNGLWIQAFKAKKMHKIKELTTTFVTLSIGDIASRAELASEKEALQLVSDMVLSGKLCAKIDQERQVVHFLDEAQEKSKDIFALQSQLADVVTHYTQLKTANNALEISEEYQKAVDKDTKSLTTDVEDILGFA